MQELFLRQQQANQASPHTNNIHQSYIAQFLAAQAPSQQMLDISGVPGMSGMGISGVPGSIGGMNGVPGMNVGMMSGGAPGAHTNAGIGVSNEDMIKKLKAEQSSQRGGNR
jgi:UDP-N-acetylenolpyruvoylglucosamine reductase